MADKKITALVELAVAPAADDLFTLVDVSEALAENQNKKIKYSTLQTALAVTPAALTKTDDTNVTITLGGSPTVALLAASSITVGWTGVLSLARGGTNKNMTAVQGGVVWTDADSMEVSVAGTTGQALISGGTGAPTWFAPTAGSVLFAGTGGILQQDNTNFFWNDTDNRLGLGINSSLAARLHIKGTTADDTATAITIANSTPVTMFNIRNDGTFILGLGATVTDVAVPNAAVAVGRLANVNAEAGIAIGLSSIGGYYCVAIGSAATTTGAFTSIAIGNNSSIAATAEGCIAIGSLASVLGAGDNAIAIGQAATIASGKLYGIAIGGDATVNQNYGIAIGRDAVVGHEYSIALGFGAVTIANHSMLIGGVAPAGAYIEAFYTVYNSSDAVHGKYFRTTTPEAAQAATRGSKAYVDNASIGIEYVKHNGTGNTGWKTYPIIYDKSVTDAAHTGSTAEVKVYSILIPANTLIAGSQMRVRARCKKSGTAGTNQLRFRFGTADDLTGALIAQTQMAATVLHMQTQRNVYVKSTAAFEVIGVGVTNQPDDDVVSTTAHSTVTIDTTVANYFVISVQLANSADTATFSGYSLEILY